MQIAGENAEGWDEVFSSDDHDGALSKNSHRDLQKESKCSKIERSATETKRQQ